MSTKATKDQLLQKIRGGQSMTFAEQLRLTILLSIPAIIAQLSSVMMQYIDTAMVGRLGAGPSASIGLVSTTTWIFGGFCFATSAGFSVQVAHLIGANDFAKARQVLRHALTSVLIFSLSLTLIGLSIGHSLPVWLGGGEDIIDDASAYFLIYVAFLPTMQLSITSGAMLQASGNMKVPSILNIMMCVMDVILNYIFIYGLDMGARGAALGTGLAEAITAVLMFSFLVFRSPELKLTQDRGSFIPDRASLKHAFGISGPMWLQNIISRGAYIASTLIVAPLGTIAIAANSFAITAESFCYMPGYGIQDAATTIIGQSLGARRNDLAKRFARITIGLGAIIMTVGGALMFFTSTQLMSLLSNDPEVIALGAKVLRIEAFAELMFAVSIVAYGCCVGGGDTLVPSAINLLSMWVVRIGLALILTPHIGLAGYWVAMCVELNVRGLLFLLRMKSGRWMKLKIT